MYTSHYGFREKPFNVTPDPRFVYMNPAFKEAYASLLTGIRERKGFVVLTGEVGTGKTTLLRVLMKNLEATVRFVYFYNTTLSFEELLTYACEELGLETGGGGRLKKIQALNDFLIDQLRHGGTGALLIDEAQHLSEHVLENLRLLSNLETSTEKLLQIILVGQPELEAKLAQPSLRQLKQRVSVQCRIDRLKDREIPAYIQFRLESVGSPSKDLFGRAAVERIAHYSNGIPRLINIICDNALTIGYATSQRTITPGIVEEVAGDLGLKETARDPAPVPVAARPAPPAVVVTTPAPAPVAPVERPAPAPVAEAASERAAEAPVVAAAPTRRERGRPRSSRPLWIAGGAVAAAALVAVGVAISPRVIDGASTVGDAVTGAASAVASTASQAWQGLMSQASLPAADSASRPVDSAPDASRPVATAKPVERAPVAATPAIPPAMSPATPGVATASPLSAPDTRVWSPAPVAPAPAPRTAVPAVTPEKVVPVIPVPAPPAPTVRAPQAAPATPAPAAITAPESNGALAAPRVAALPAENSRATTAIAPVRPADQRPMVIPQGGTISDIAYRTYGQYSTLAVDLIKEFNPHIADLDWIRTGDRLWLPPLTRETLIRPQADGSHRLIVASFLSSVAADKLTDAIRRRGLDARVTPRQVTGQLALYRVEIAGLNTRDAAESAWRAALANCWIFIADAPCERTNP